MKKLLLLSCLLVLLLVSCAVLPPTVQRFSSMEGYKYVYITPTSETTSVTGATYGTKYGVYGLTGSRSVSPTDVIAGHFMNRGYIRQPEINPDFAEQTLFVNYGETKHEYDGFGYTIGVTIQVISAKTNNVVCVGSAEGRAEIEADALRDAVNNCMNEIFNW